jgi:hypothetical protein
MRDAHSLPTTSGVEVDQTRNPLLGHCRECNELLNSEELPRSSRWFLGLGIEPLLSR